MRKLTEQTDPIQETNPDQQTNPTKRTNPIKQTNLAKQSPHRVQRMERDLLAWFEDVCTDLKKTSRE